MTRDDIIGWMQEVGAKKSDLTPQTYDGFVDLFQRFAALVAAAEREAIGNIILDYAGRDDLSDSDESLLKHLFELIRARGEV